TLDPSLPRSLYPLAWLIGAWEGRGALAAPSPDTPHVRVEQRLVRTPQARRTLAGRSRIHRAAAPDPLPRTSAPARARDVAGDAPAAPSTGERSLLHREDGVWTVGDLLPGQDRAAAEAARPGSPEGQLSHHLEARFERRGEAAETWRGEVRGPRLQLALPGADGEVAATRMVGYISGRLMWLWEQRGPAPEGAPGET